MALLWRLGLGEAHAGLRSTSIAALIGRVTRRVGHNQQIVLHGWLAACLQNDAGLAAMAADVASKLLGADAYAPLAEPSMAAEDFSFYAQSVPAVFTLLGSGGTNPPGVGLHNPQFTLDEGVLPQGAALHAALAVEWVERQSGGAKDEL